MGALHEVAVAAGGVTDQVQLAELVVERARRIAGGDAAVLRWFDVGTSTFQLLASVGAGPGPEEQIAVDAQTAIGDAFKTREPVIVNDYQASDQATPWGRRTGIVAQVAVPLLVEGRPVGTLVVLSYHPHAYRDSDALFLSLMAAIVAPALEAARLSREVRRQVERRAQIYEALPAMIVVYGRDGKALQHNSAAQAALGAQVLDSVRERSIELYREDGTPIPEDERPFAKAMRAKRPVRGTVVGFGDNPRRWAYIDAVPLFDEQGKVDAVITSSIDITELKAAQAEQRQSEQLFSAAFRASGIGMALTDLAGSVIRANPALCQLVGYAESDLAGMDARKLVVEDDVQRVVETLARLYVDADPPMLATDLRVIHRDGRHVWARLTASLIQVDGEPRNVLLHLVDVTEERKAEAILLSEQDRLGEIIDAQREIAGTEVDLEQLLGVLVARTVRLTGAGAAAVLLPKGDSLIVRAAAGSPELIIGYELPIDQSLAGLAFVTGRLQQVGDAKTDKRAHTPTAIAGRIGAMVAAPLVSGGRTIGVLQLLSGSAGGLDELDARTLEMIAGFAAAAFERATSTTRLMASEQRVRAVIESAPDPIVIFDPSGALVEFNPAAEKTFGRSRDDAVGSSALGLLAPRHAEGFARWMRNGRAAGSAEYAGRHFEVTGRRADGTDFPMEIAIANLAGEAQLAAAFLRDMSLRDRLKESRERLAAVVASAHVILLASGKDGVVTLAEGSGLTGFDLSAELLVGRDLREALGGQADAVRMLDLAQRGQTVSGVFRMTKPDRSFEGVFSPIHDSEGSVSGVSVVLTDVTDRLLQAAREASLLAALSDAGEGIVITENHRILSCNDAYVTLTGYSREELQALPAIYDLAPANERATVAETVRAALATRKAIVHVETALVTKDGRRREIDITITSLNEEGTAPHLSIVRDVTDRRRAEEAQRESDAKSRLMAMMNHEVRTPLNSILGFAQLLTDPRMGELSEKQRRYVTNIQVSGNHLLALVNDSLDLAKLDAGAMPVRLEAVAVRPALELAADQVRPLAQARGVALEVDATDAVIVADMRQLVQVLLNLLSNAIRHTQSGGRITMRVRAAGDMVSIDVEDTGQGIAREELPRLFEEFYQAANHAPGGIGLGLAISRRLVQLMGGSIAVESELGRGSIFTVRLPAGRTAAI